jgi:hypothetical protein
MLQRMRPPTEAASQGSEEGQDGANPDSLQDGSDPDARRDVARSTGASRYTTRRKVMRPVVEVGQIDPAANDGVEFII